MTTNNCNNCNKCQYKLYNSKIIARNVRGIWGKYRAHLKQ